MYFLLTFYMTTWNRNNGREGGRDAMITEGIAMGGGGGGFCHDT